MRINLLHRLQDLNEVVKIESLHEQFIPSLTELALANDKNWRIKLALMEKFPAMARQLGLQFFEARLSSMCEAWLSDKIYSIREAAIKNYSELCDVFGPEWASQHVVPRFTSLQSDESFIKRQVALLGISAVIPKVDI